MSKIYLPTEYINKSCKVVYNDYIRVYDNNSYTTWTDIYFKNDYMLKGGSSTYGQNVVCDTLNNYTDNFYYRYDFPHILTSLFIVSFFCIFIPIKIFSKIFIKGGL